MPHIRTIIQYFKDLLDVPPPSPGKYLRWGTDDRLENAAGPSGGGGNVVYNEVHRIASLTRRVELAHEQVSGTVVVHLNSARLSPGADLDFEEAAAALEFTFDLEPGDVVLVDYNRL